MRSQVRSQTFDSRQKKGAEACKLDQPALVTVFVALVSYTKQNPLETKPPSTVHYSTHARATSTPSSTPGLLLHYWLVPHGWLGYKPYFCKKKFVMQLLIVNDDDVGLIVMRVTFVIDATVNFY